MTKKLISFAALSDPADERAAELLYTAAFPPEERRLWDGILHPQSPYGPQLSIIRISYPDSAPRFAGIITVWEFETLRYIEHFAIDDCLRGSGIGADVLHAVLADSPKPVVLEVEPPADDNPMAARRISFYRRCGLQILPHPYIQPPYSPGLPAVPLLLMASDAKIDPAMAEKLLHRQVYNHVQEAD